MGQAKNRGTFEQRVLQAIRQQKFRTAWPTESPHGKVVAGKFVYHEPPQVPGYDRVLPESAVKQFGDDLLRQYQDPTSLVSKMTVEMRAKGIHCMKDDLDQGADIYELVRRSIRIKNTA